jgi:hypothetical protein
MLHFPTSTLRVSLRHTLLCVVILSTLSLRAEDRLPPSPQDSGAYVLNNQSWQRLYIEKPIARTAMHNLSASLRNSGSFHTAFDLSFAGSHAEVTINR